ncbi:hypothetical protein ACH4D4_34470 [Streptomyces pristinaespiralis]|uniref:hypothetical protein n=1 Tax=Streptomyces pristinaespiralis TaxID=38300 RepID=UPI0033E3C1BC
MPTGRDRRHRLAVTASLLLGLLGALLGCMGAATGAAEPAPVAATGAAEPAPVPAAGPDAAPAWVAGPVAPPAQPPGCGRGADDDDRNAHPGTPPRGGSAYELLPALHHGGGASGPGALLPDRAFLDGSPLPAPPPAAPPTPVALSVLRV